MKLVIILILVFLVAAAFIRLRSTGSLVSPGTSPETTLSSSVTPILSLVPEAFTIADVQRENGVYTIVGQEVASDALLSLLPNFSQRLSGQQLVQAHGCALAINGGFYTQEGRPLGWFVSEGSQEGARIESNLVTGFFWQDRKGKRHISRAAPSEQDVDFVLQTGPYMEVKNRPLQLISDEPARRSVLGIDDGGRLYFLSVIQKENSFSGPLLADLPVLFNNAAVQNAVPFRALLNLDGGTASFFYHTDDQEPFMLSELKPIGSLLCVE